MKMKMNKYRVTGWRRIDLEYEAVVEADNLKAAEQYVEEDYEEYRTQENTDGYEWVSTEIWNGKWQILSNSNEKQKERLALELTALESTPDDEETTLFILWAAETSRTTQDMVSTFMGWCAHHEYTCQDDLPEEMQKYEGGI